MTYSQKRLTEILKKYLKVHNYLITRLISKINLQLDFPVMVSCRISHLFPPDTVAFVFDVQLLSKKER